MAEVAATTTALTDFEFHDPRCVTDSSENIDEAIVSKL
jgi:hypothetical protein